jgi:hypothetical protein
MIISHRHRFIFLKTRKTAGTSIEIALSQLCGPQDVITPIPPQDEEIRQRLGYPGPQNCMLTWRHYTPKAWLRLLRKGMHPHFYNHMRAYRVRGIVGRSIWKTYFTFCVERNPYDKALSLYYWRTRHMHPRPSFHAFLHSPAAKKMSNYPIYSILGSVAVDHVALYENLEHELESIRARCNLPQPLKLPRAKGTYRGDRGHYRDSIDDQDRKKIYALCKKEIHAFSYAF